MKYMSVAGSYTHNWTNLTAAAEVQNNIAAVVQGSGDHERVGRRIFIHYVDVHIDINRLLSRDDTSVIDVTSNNVGVYLVLDNQANELTTNVTANMIWEDADYGSGSATSLLAFPNRRYEQRFSILKEAIVEDKLPPPWTNPGNPGPAGQDADFDKFIRWRIPINMIFSFNNNGAFENTDKALRLWAKFDLPDQEEMATVVYYQTRICFEDSSTVQ